MANRRRFSSLTPDDVFFHGPAEALALKHQEDIEHLFRPYEITKTDLVLCSVAAYSMVRRNLRGRCRVVAVPDSLGGTTTFAATVTTADPVSAVAPGHRERGSFPTRLLAKQLLVLSRTGPLRRRSPSTSDRIPERRDRGSSRAGQRAAVLPDVPGMRCVFWQPKRACPVIPARRRRRANPSGLRPRSTARLGRPSTCRAPPPLSGSG